MKTFTAELPQLFCLLDWWWCPAFLVWGVSYSNGRKETDTAALPCCGIRSSAHTQCKIFYTLGKGNSWEFGLLPPALFPRTVPAQKARPSRMWADFLTTACSWLPSLLGSKTNTLLYTCLCSAYWYAWLGERRIWELLGRWLARKMLLDQRFLEIFC